MSKEALVWAAGQRTERPADKLVLFALANHVPHGFDVAHPSVAAIVDFSRLNRKTVLASFAGLKAADLIEDTGHRVGRTQQVIVWRLAMKQSQKGDRIADVKQSQKRDRLTGANDPRNGTVSGKSNSPENGTRNLTKRIISKKSCSGPPCSSSETAAGRLSQTHQRGRSALPADADADLLQHGSSTDSRGKVAQTAEFISPKLRARLAEYRAATEAEPDNSVVVPLPKPKPKPLAPHARLPVHSFDPTPYLERERAERATRGEPE